MTITTNKARTLLALDLVQKYSSVYFSIGQATAWNSNDTPPTEDPTTSIIANPIAYAQAKVATLCRPLQQGEATPSDAIVWGASTYVRVAQADAYSQGATYVYFETTVAKADVGSDNVSYRTTGVNVGLVPKQGVTKPVILPADVVSTGILISYANKAVNTLDDETSVKLGALYTLAPLEA